MCLLGYKRVKDFGFGFKGTFLQNLSSQLIATELSSGPLFYLFIFCFGGTQGPTLARQALYHLSHTPQSYFAF
jgi:hypothetical protein